jgi:hypothetical protein
MNTDKQSTTGYDHGTDKSSSHPRTSLLSYKFQYYPTIFARVSKVVSSLGVFSLNTWQIYLNQNLCLSNGYRELSTGEKRWGREADYSPSISAEIKKIWFYTSTPPYAFMA